MNQDMFVPIVKSAEQMQQEAIDRQVAEVFQNAEHFNSAYPVILEWARGRGWVFAFAHGQWHTQSRTPGTIGVNGPRFDTLGDLLTWLFEQPNSPTPIIRKMK